MDDYTRYVTAVNKIFDYVEKMKAGWNNLDNKNYIESINDYKSVVTSKAELIKRPPTVVVEKAEGSHVEETLNIDGSSDKEIDLNLDIEEDEDDIEESLDEEPSSSSGPDPIQTFSPSPSSRSSSGGPLGIPELPDFSGLTDISEAPRIKTVERLSSSGKEGGF